jgi:hypothetical protein
VKGKNILTNISAARMYASLFGVLAGLGGLTHGPGEILQGNVAPEGIVINSWTVGPIAAHMGGDPGMTIIPNFLITGMLTIIVSLAVIVWSAAFVQRERGGLILILLSIAMLLVGGGFAPPIIGVLAGVAGLGIEASFTWWRAHLSTSVRRLLATLWPWVFGVCAIVGLFLVIGHVVLVGFFGMTNSTVFVYSFFFIVLSFPLAIFTGVAYDIQAGDRHPSSG